MAAKLAHPREMEAKQLVIRDRPPEAALAVGDEAVHRNAHRVDQQGSRPYPPGDRLGNGVAYGRPRPAASMPGPKQEEEPSKSCSRVSQIAKCAHLAIGARNVTGLRQSGVEHFEIEPRQPVRIDQEVALDD